MFIQKFLNNPNGDGNIDITNRNAKTQFEQRYNDNKAKIRSIVYDINGILYIHVKIPSSVESILYDVVIKLIEGSNSTGLTIYDMDFQIFSNCPSFIYTYANAYYKRHMFIRELTKKISKEAVKTVASVRNPDRHISYEFSTYLALRYVMDLKPNITALRSSARKCGNVAPMARYIQDWDTLSKMRDKQKKAIAPKTTSNIKEPKMSNITKDDKSKGVVNIKPTQKSVLVSKASKSNRVRKK